jgi:hypothetical protein
MLPATNHGDQHLEPFRSARARHVAELTVTYRNPFDILAEMTAEQKKKKATGEGSSGLNPVQRDGRDAYRTLCLNPNDEVREVLERARVENAGAGGLFCKNPAMTSILTKHAAALAELCVRHRVTRLAVFGSAAGDDFDEAISDVDLLEAGPIRNPYLKRSIDETRVVVYEAA